jgi:hypothetical protein
LPFEETKQQTKRRRDVEGFEKAWGAYPRKVNKGDARKAWGQTARIRPPLDELIAAIEAQKQSEQWLEQGGRFIPHFSTWLRGERWADELQIDLGANKNGKAWHETASGVEAKGAELGLLPSQFKTPSGTQDWQAFRAAVVRAAGSTVRAA